MAGNFFFVLVIGLCLFRVDSFGVAQAPPCEASSSLNADRRPKELPIGPGERQFERSTALECLWSFA
ncbi:MULTISPECIES: hypothetical protein [unclassified Bradyrhizobium]|uniref:Secreted protein n=1 Tax=Bradyrhizobium sp. LLZ17 TaxID=3239388 RepID=A0AB39XU86_9BRAD